MGDIPGLSFGVRDGVNFLGGCSEKTKLCALEVTEESVPDVVDAALSEVAEVGR